MRGSEGGRHGTHEAWAWLWHSVRPETHILPPSVPDDDINDRTEGERKRGVEGERRAKESSLQLPVHAPLPPFHSTAQQAQHLPLELEGK